MNRNSVASRCIRRTYCFTVGSGWDVECLNLGAGEHYPVRTFNSQRARDENGHSGEWGIDCLTSRTIIELQTPPYHRTRTFQSIFEHPDAFIRSHSLFRSGADVNKSLLFSVLPKSVHAKVKRYISNKLTLQTPN